MVKRRCIGEFSGWSTLTCLTEGADGLDPILDFCHGANLRGRCVVESQYPALFTVYEFYGTNVRMKVGGCGGFIREKGIAFLDGENVVAIVDWLRADNHRTQVRG